MSKYYKSISTFFGLLFANGVAHADANQTTNMHEHIAHFNLKIHWMQISLLWLCIAISIAVFSSLAYLLFKHRKIEDPKTQFHQHAWQELLWAVIPFIILVLLALPTIIILL